MEKNLTQEIATRQNFDKIVSYWNMLPDPDPILRKIGKDISTYRELMTDPHLFSTIQQRKSGVLSLNWELQQQESAQNEFDFIHSILNNLNLENLIDQILNTPLFGYTVFEIIWKKDGNYLIPDRIDEKPQEWFFFDQYNNLNLKKNFNPNLGTNEGEIINPLKFILVQHKPTYQNPYGERALSRCFWPVTFKRGGLKFWITFTEKYGNPFMIGKLPRGSAQTDIDNLLTSLDNMIQDAVAVIPDDSSVEIKEAQRSSSVEVFKELMDFMNSEISKAILTQTLTTEVQDTGTYAASKTMGDMLAKVQQADQRLVERAINKIIDLIYQVNFNSINKPKFILYADEDVDKLLAERDQILVNTGIKFTKDYYIRNYNLLPEDFDITEKPVNPEFAEKNNVGIKIALPDEKKLTDEIINQLPDKLLQLQIESTLKPVLSLIENGETYETIMEELAKTYPAMSTNQLEELLTKLLFISEITGRNSVSS
jgi:phage gp29-like protein